MSGWAAVERSLERLQRVAPAVAQRAHQGLQAPLARLATTAWPETLHRFSSLTNTGYPLEWAWSSRDSQLRCTLEVAPAECAEALRLPTALDDCRAQASSAAGQPTAVVAQATHGLQALQDGADLRFGAWLGLRFSATAAAAKLYAELPAGACTQAWVARVWAESHPRATPVLWQWRMAGLSADGALELYARTGPLEGGELAASLQALGAEPGAWLVAMQRLTRQAGLPQTGGLSLALDAAGRFQALTWFVFAKHLQASDGSIFQACSALAQAWGQDSTIYEALAHGPDDGRWRHGMVGLGLGRDGRVWLQAGLRPT
jgi:hypothetical protein